MHINKKSPYYSPYTGKLVGYKWGKVASRCDFSGQLIEVDDVNSAPQFTVTLDYGCVDPMYGSYGEEYEFSQKHHIRVEIFLEDPYEISYEYAAMAVQEAAKRGMDIQEALRTFRVEAAMKLIEEGTVTAEALTGFSDAEYSF